MRIITLITAATIAGTSMASAASLSDVDRNDDGKISFQEWDHTYGTEKGIISFKHTDQNNDGFLDFAEFRDAQVRGVLSSES